MILSFSIVEWLCSIYEGQVKRTQRRKEAAEESLRGGASFNLKFSSGRLFEFCRKSWFIAASRQ